MNPLPADPDALFLRWRDSGDASAVAALFDAVGGDLFRVAVSLCGDGAAAEDAVQETFLVALRTADGFDGTRAVMPWLLGILSHKAADARRRARRVPDPLRLPPSPLPADPAEEAERREAVTRVRAALDRLPDPYRAVALLRWEYGMEPGDIARILDRPPGTVRSLLSRARERLERSLRGASLLALLGGPVPRGLDAVKAHILRAAALRPIPVAPAAAGVSLATLLGGLLVAKKTVVAAAVVGALLLVGTVARFVMEGDEPPTAVPGTGGGTTVAAAGKPIPSPAEGVDAVAPVAARREARLSLRVVDTAGRPVVGARATVRPMPPADFSNPWRARHREPLPTADDAPASVSDATGSLVVAGLPAGRCRLRVEAKDFAIRTEDRDAEVGESAPVHTIVLVSAWTLEGTVFDAEGAPVAGAEVITAAAFARADGKGRYRLEGLPAGRHSVSVRTDGAMVMDFLEVALPGTSHLDIHLEGGAALTGTVLDDDTGDPVPGAKVFLMAQVVSRYPNMSQFTAETFTDETGSFRIDRIPASAPSLVDARAEGYLQCTGWYTAVFPSQYRFLKGEVLHLDLRLRRGVVVRGRILGPGDVPVAGASVELLQERPRESTARATSGISGADGTYRILAVPGSGCLLARAPGLVAPGLPADLWTTTKSGGCPLVYLVNAEPGKEVVLDVRMVEAPAPAVATAVIAGTVRSGDGLPSTGASVTARGASRFEARGPVTEDGSFRLEHLPAGTFRLAAGADGRESPEIAVGDLREGEIREGLELVLQPVRRVTGRVTDGDGAPIPGAAVAQLTRDKGWMEASTVVATSGPDGEFDLAGLPDGEVSLEFTAPGFARRAHTLGAADTTIEIRLERALAIEGMVVERDGGRPVRGVFVTATPSAITATSGVMRFHENVTGADGRFRIDGLDRRDFDLETGRLEDRGPAAGYRPARLTGIPAGTVDTRIELEAGLAIAGRVLDEERRPVGGGTVDARRQPGGPPLERHANVAADGAFLVPGLPPGNYDLTVQPGGSLAPVAKTGVAAGTTDLKLVTVPFKSISGWLLMEDGKPVPRAGGGGIHVWFTGDDGKTTVTSLSLLGWKEDGSFETLPLDPAKIYDLVFHGRPGILGGAVRNVTPGAREVTLTVQRGGFIEGHVVDENGTAIAGIWVSASTREIPDTFPEQPGRSVHVRSGPDGSFRLEGLANFPYSLHAGGSDTDFLSTGTKLPVRPGTSDVVLSLRRGSAIGGRVLAREGTPQRGGYLMLLQDRSSCGGALVGEDGRFEVRGIPPGTYRLRLQVGDLTEDLGEVTAPARDLVLTRPAE